MLSTTLAEAVERIKAGGSSYDLLVNFVEAFDLIPASVDRYVLLEDEPSLTDDKRIDALVGGVAEYLAKQHKLGRVPPWASKSCRYLDTPWHTWPFADAGLREYLTFASPVEFASRNIFTEERPLRRDQSPLGRQILGER